MVFFKGDRFGAKDFHRMARSIELTFSDDVFLELMSVLNRGFFKIFIMVDVTMETVFFLFTFYVESDIKILSV